MSQSLGPELSAELGLTLLTGQQSTADRKRAMLAIVSGKAKLVVGTHALIANKVEFYDLALTVIDEQHRFGVEQREALRQKGKTAPHVLTMTATPIPSTLAVTVFGDLDVSTLTELPGGRQVITSHVVQFANPTLVARTWQRIAEACAAGRQAFVVCPRIDEDDPAEELVEAGGSLEQDDVNVEDILEPKVRTPIASALGMTEALRRNTALAGLRIDVLHGRMAGDEKNEVMSRFSAGQIDVLVSTTVIEVGVNVPNATVMVVLDADRFGVAQLHQLRGRVGRGSHPGLCLLLTTAEDLTPALERVKAVAATNDGFELSQIDLELRREGDVLGDRQSGGRSSLRLLRVVQDVDLIQRMRTAVASIFATDPTLEKHKALGETLTRIDAAVQENLAKS
jgi:ATP-dependent DNA helicase RecG